MRYCARVERPALFDLRADALLRSGRKTGVIRPSCSWCTALEPLVGNYQTFRADALLRSGRKTGVIRPSCSWCTALEPLVGNYQTFVQIRYYARVGRPALFDLRADCVLRPGLWLPIIRPSRAQCCTKAGRRARLERQTRPNSPNARKVARVWSAKPDQTLQTREKLRTFGAAAITQALGCRDEPPDAHTAGQATPQARHSCAP